MLRGKRLELRSCLQLRACEAKKLSYPLQSPVCFAVTRRSRSKARQRYKCMLQCFALHAICNQINFKQILKFHKRVISALILVASFARPKISSQFLRVNESFKICKKALLNFKILFLHKSQVTPPSTLPCPLPKQALSRTPHRHLRDRRSRIDLPPDRCDLDRCVQDRPHAHC